MSACAARAPLPFAATVKPIVALALPLAPLVTASHPLSLDVVHPQPGRVWIVTASDPPPYPTSAAELLSAYRHVAAASTT